MERYAETDGESSEAVTGDEVHTAGDFLIEETAFRNNGIFQRKSTKILRGKNRTGRETGKTYPPRYGADGKAGRIFRCSFLRKDISEIRETCQGI